MYQKKVDISNLADVKAVVEVASVCTLGVTAQDAKGQTADACSILGILSLDHSCPVELSSRDEQALEAIEERLAALKTSR